MNLSVVVISSDGKGRTLYALREIANHFRGAKKTLPQSRHRVAGRDFPIPSKQRDSVRYGGGRDHAVKGIAMGKVKRNRNASDFPGDRNHKERIRNLRQKSVETVLTFNPPFVMEVSDFDENDVGNDQLGAVRQGDDLTGLCA